MDFTIRVLMTAIELANQNKQVLQHLAGIDPQPTLPESVVAIPVSFAPNSIDVRVTYTFRLGISNQSVICVVRIQAAGSIVVSVSTTP